MLWIIMNYSLQTLIASSPFNKLNPGLIMRALFTFASVVFISLFFLSNR